MTIETQISLNMTNNQAPVVVDVVQGEQMTRAISATLYDGAQPWSVPKNAKAGLAFRKPDGTGGLYDQLPDHSIAVTIVGNNVKATLAPQVQSVAGDVATAIVFMVPSTMERLATFPFVLRVAKDPSTGSPASNDYYQYSTMEEVNAAIKDVKASANAATQAVAGFQQAVAPALPVTMTGREVSTNMVSPVEHEVVCKVESLNLFNINAEPQTVITINPDGSFVVPSGVYTASLRGSLGKMCSELKEGDVFWFYMETESTVKFFYSLGLGQPINSGKQYTATKELLGGGIILYGTAKNQPTYPSDCKISNFRIVRKKDVPYTQYISNLSNVTVTRQPDGKIFNPRPDGIVTGMVSKYPNMTILTDNPNVTVEATYNADTKKYIDKKFAELQAAIVSTGGNV